MQKFSRTVRVLDVSIARGFSSKLSVDEISKAQKHRQVLEHSRTPYPKTITDFGGSGKELHEPENLTEMRVFSGMPSEQAGRTVVISPRPRKTLQSGFKYDHQWQLTWKNEERWSNPLMGWTSTSDPMCSLKLTFNSKEDAEAYAKRSGFKFETRAPASTNIIEPGSYIYEHNFLAKKVKQMLVEKGPLHKMPLFTNSKYGNSNWFMPLTYHGDKPVMQYGPRSPPAPAAAAK